LSFILIDEELDLLKNNQKTALVLTDFLLHHFNDFLKLDWTISIKYCKILAKNLRGDYAL